MPVTSFQNALFTAIRQRWTGYYTTCVRAFDLDGDATEDMAGYDGTATDVVWGVGKYGIRQSAYFDGAATPTIVIGSNADIDNLAAFTVVASIYPASAAVARSIYTKTSVAAGQVYFYVTAQAAGYCSLYGSVDCATTKAQSTSTVVVPISDWSNVAMTWNNTTKLVGLFLNGTEVTYAPQVTGVGAQKDDSAGSAYIGSSFVLAPFDGFIDTFRLYSSILPAARMSWFIETPLYLGHAPQDTEYPYVTMDLISGMPLYQWDGTDEECRVQFSVFAEDGTMSAEETVGCIVEGIRRTFDNQLLEVTGYNNVACIRDVETMSRWEEVMQATQDYIFTAAD